MFKFLKDKLKTVAKSISKKAEKVEKPQKKKGLFKKIKEKVTTTKISEDKFNELFWDLEVILLENNVATEVIDLFKDDLKEKLVDKPLKRGEIEEKIKQGLKDCIENLFRFEKFNLVEEINKSEKPYVICFVGVNGSGKTTTISKVVHLLQRSNLKCVLAAADTFRAASIEQLEKHGKKLGVKVIKHKYGADPAAVAFDAIEHAKAKHLDVVLIDTAGRMHSNFNLIEEMRKIIDVSKPDLKIFVGESITGNDCVEQARSFNDAINLDCIILTKVDVDEKGGAAISVSYVTGKPIIYFGCGQSLNDLEEFDKSKVLDSLGL